MQAIQLTVEHRYGVNGEPYMVIDGLPRLGAELDPEQAQAKLRKMLLQHGHAETVPEPELWAVHAQGPDDLYAAFNREDAETHAAELNAMPMPEGIAIGAVVVPSPWPTAEHWKYLAEQEREHNALLVAQAGQVPEAFNLLHALITGTTGRWVLSQLDDGQGTELEDGKNWLAARALVAAAPAQGGE